MVCFEIPEFCVDCGSFDQRQQVALHSLRGNAFANVGHRALGDCQLIDLVEEDYSVLLYVLYRHFLQVERREGCLHALVIASIEEVAYFFDSLRDGLIGKKCLFDLQIGSISWHKRDDLIIIMPLPEINQLLLFKFAGKILPNHGVQDLQFYLMFDAFAEFLQGAIEFGLVAVDPNLR